MIISQEPNSSPSANVTSGGPPTDQTSMITYAKASRVEPEYLGFPEDINWSNRSIVVSGAEHLENQIAVLTHTISALSQKKIFGVLLTTLAPAPYRVLAPISLTIESDFEDYSASYYEANVAGSGETESDAIADFKEALISVFESLTSLPEEMLGTIPYRQFVVLKSVMERVE